MCKYPSAVNRDKSQVPPKPIVRLGLAILRGVNWSQNSIVPAPMRIADLSFGGYTLSEVLRTAAALGIADKLAQGPMTAEALAEEIGRYICSWKHPSKSPSACTHCTPHLATNPPSHGQACIVTAAEHEMVHLSSP